MKIILIAALAEDGAIGKGNALLWHISGDMKFFRKTTLGFPVIMGYNTWLSLGRPLKGRKNIVVSKCPLHEEGIVVVPSLEEALREALVPMSDEHAPDQVFVIGGAKTYDRAIGIADELLITEVRAVVDGADAYFPKIEPSIWQLASATEYSEDEENGIRYRFVRYIRR